jgi:hypothetical protein
VESDDRGGDRRDHPPPSGPPAYILHLDEIMNFRPSGQAAAFTTVFSFIVSFVGISFVLGVD